MLIRATILLALISQLHAWESPGSGLLLMPEDLLTLSDGALVTGDTGYRQLADITISPMDTLRVPAGTEWLAAADVELRITGVIQSLGRPFQPVVFAAEGAAPGSWSGLILDDGSGRSHLVCTELRDGEDGLICLGASPLVEFCQIENNLSSGLSCFLEGNPTLRHTTIRANMRYGVEITGSSSPRLEHCVIQGNNLEASDPRNAVSIGIQGTNSPVLISCLLEGAAFGNPASGFSLWMSGNPQLHHCEIRGFRSGVVIQGAGATGSLENCWIHDNRYSNPMLGGSGINVNTSAMPTFRNCLIEGNDWGVTVTSVSQPDFGTGESLGMNRLHDNGNNGGTYDFWNNTTGLIEASGNWWGTLDGALINEHINDSQDGNFGTVSIYPILDDSLFAPVIAPDAGWMALEEGRTLAIRPADHFRSLPGLSFSLVADGLVTQMGDSIYWTPPAEADSLQSLLLYAQTSWGMESCDTLRVWLDDPAAIQPQIAISVLGASVRLEWLVVENATAYRLERAPDPHFTQGVVTVIYTGAATSFLDEGALALGHSFYRVVALLP